MSKTKLHTVYKSEVGDRLPSVTTVIGILNKPFLLEWAWRMGTEGQDYKKVRDAAADAGTLAHAMILAHIKGEQLDMSEYSKETIDLAENSFLSYLTWEKDHHLAPQIVEKPMVSALGFGGTPDFYGLVDASPTLLDFKTGRGLYDEYTIQLAAYNRLLVDNGYPPAEQFRLLKIGRDANDNYEEKVIKDISIPWQIFESCLRIYQLQKIMKGDK